MAPRQVTPAPRPTRVSVLGGNGATYEPFEVVTFEGAKLVVRGPLLFEVGENLRLKVERDGNVSEVKVRISAHAGSGEDVLTELTVLETQPVKRLISG
jgi:hypothetical protein